jgi:hypothetical protein
VSRAARRARPRREQRRISEGLVRRVLDLSVGGNSPSSIAKIVGLPEVLVVSILESMAEYLAEQGEGERAS